MNSWRRSAGWAPCVLLVAAVCGCAQGAGGQASCAAPVITTKSDYQLGRALPRVVTVSPGQELRIYGYFFETCHDTNNQPPPRPFKHLTVIVTQSHKQETLAVVSARQPGGTFSIRVRLPADLHPGSATVRTSGGAPENPLRLEIRASHNA